MLDTCTKTVFSFKNKLYQQKDGVSMGSSLRPVLANIIMTELEHVVIKPLIANATIKFYTNFVDDTLLVIKPDDVKEVHNFLNKFDKNFRFTVDMFQNNVLHFLDLELSADGILIFRKDTNTGLYVNFTSFVPWTYCTLWIKTLVTRASRICAPNKLSSEINIKRFASWNDFPKSVVNSIISKTLNTPSNNEGPNINNTEKGSETTIYFRFPYHDKSSFVTPKIEKTPKLNESFVVYEFISPGYNANYVGKTETTLHERCAEDAWDDKDSVVFNHLNECIGVQHMLETGKSTPSLLTNNIIHYEFDLRSSHVNLV